MVKKRDDIDGLVSKFKASRDEDSDNDSEEDRPKKPFVDYPSFNLLIGFFIGLNAVTMGIECDARGENGDNVSGIFFIIELFFCMLFLGEVVARLYYHGMEFFNNVHSKWWNISDLIIVGLSVIDSFIFTPLGLGGGGRIITLLRFLRLMRLIRLVRLMRLFKELWLVASGLFESAKTLCWVALMIVSFIFICSIFTTLTIGKNDKLYDQYFLDSGGWDHEEYFRTVPRSMFTLFQIVTFESWSERVVRHVMQKQPAMVVFFIFFIAVASFGFLNIVVGIVVESTLRTSEADDNKIKRAQERDRQRVFDHLREIFEAADEDGSGTLTLGEVEKAINKPEIYNKLKMIEFPVEDPKQIFELLDYDNSLELSIDEFINGCIGMKGTAKSKDLLAAQVAVDTMKRHYLLFENEMKQLQGKIALLDDTARALVYQGEHVFLNLREYRMRHPELEGGIASPPRVDTAAMHSAPWEGGAKPLSIDDRKKEENQAAIWDDAFNKPGGDEWAVVPMRPETASEFMANSREGFGSLTNIDSSKCQWCMAPMQEGKKFCTSCGKERAQALTNGPGPPALMNSANNGQAALMNNSSNGRRVQVQTTDLAIPGSM